jgi:sugar lactone lactonase YvrE
LTLAGLTFTVTQAGANYAPATATIPLVTTGLNAPAGVAVDGQGNVYIADTGNNVIREYSPTTQQVTPLVTSGLNGPVAVAVDASGNVYIADPGNHAMEQWNATTQQLTTLASGLGDPDGVAFGLSGGNLYFSDAANNDIDVWNTANPSAVVVASSGLSGPAASRSIIWAMFISPIAWRIRSRYGLQSIRMCSPS